MDKAKRYNQDKVQMDLLCFTALEGQAKVLTKALDKYDRHNWTLGLRNSGIIASLLRHLSAYQRGEDIDPESGLPHVHHISCNAMFLGSNYELRKHLDDRPCSDGSQFNDVPSSSVPKGTSNCPTVEASLINVIGKWVEIK